MSFDSEKGKDGNGNGGLWNPTFVGPEDESGSGSGSGRGGVPKFVPNPNIPSMEYGANESRRMLKNVIVISCAFTLLFTAFSSMSNLQSSLNTAVRLSQHNSHSHDH